MSLITYKAPDEMVNSELYKKYTNLCEEYYTENIEKYKSAVLERTTKLIDQKNEAIISINEDMNERIKNNTLRLTERYQLSKEIDRLTREVDSLGKNLNVSRTCYFDAGIYAAKMLGPTQFDELKTEAITVIDRYGLEGARMDDVTYSIQSTANAISSAAYRYFVKENSKDWNELCDKSVKYEEIFEKGTIRSVTDKMKELHEHNQSFFKDERKTTHEELEDAFR